MFADQKRLADAAASVDDDQFGLWRIHQPIELFFFGITSDHFCCHADSYPAKSHIEIVDLAGDRFPEVAVELSGSELRRAAIVRPLAVGTLFCVHFRAYQDSDFREQIGP